MASLDVDSLFTNVPLEEAINVCVNELLKINSDIHGFNKKQITKMLSLTTKESIILFDITFYTQVEGVAMGSTLRPSFANAFLCHYEMFYILYVDDIFVLFIRPEYVKPLVDYTNSKHKNIR